MKKYELHKIEENEYLGTFATKADKQGKIRVELVNSKNDVIAKQVINITNNKWPVRCIRHWRRSPLQHPVLSALLA